MPDPLPRSNARMLWPLVTALLLVLLIVWMLSPSGDTDEPGVEDPIVMEDFADTPAPDAGSLDLDDTLPPSEGAETAGPPADRQPIEAPPPQSVPPPAGQ